MPRGEVPRGPGSADVDGSEGFSNGSSSQATSAVDSSV